MAMAADDDHQTQIVLGKGLGFGFKRGDTLPPERIERIFQQTLTDNRIDPEQILREIDTTVFQEINTLANDVEVQLGFKLSDYNYLALADHLSFAIKRANNPNFKHSRTQSTSGLKNIYPKEYAAALVTIQKIQSDMGITLDQDEVSFLTYHYVNAATSGLYLAETVEMTKLIQKVTQLISYLMQVDIDTNTTNFTRFVTHIRYFIQRQEQNEPLPAAGDQALRQVVISSYPECYSVATKVATLLQQLKGWQVNEEETVYLTLHIWRLTRE